MAKETMMIVGVPFLAPSIIKDGTPDDLYQENLIQARDFMEELRVAWGTPSVAKVAEKLKIESWQAWLHELPRILSAHYEIQKDDIWAAWSRHHGPTLSMEVLKEMPSEGC